MRYRRANTPGATYFFTLNAANRQGRLLIENIDALRASFQVARHSRPFTIDAICVLPEHLHLLMTLPAGDANFAARIRLMKQEFSRRIEAGETIDIKRVARRERGLWQRRYWEHQIRDEQDLARHAEYIHFNPVKHGWVQRAVDWPFSSIHRFIRSGTIDADWRMSVSDAPGFGER